MYIQTSVEVVDDVAPMRRVSQLGRMRLVSPAATGPGVVAEITSEKAPTKAPAPANGAGQGEMDQCAALEAELAAESEGDRAPESEPAPEASVPLTPAAVKIGDRLGNYDLLEVLGEGGMGTVFLGEHTVLKRTDALKVLLPEFCNEPNVVRRFFHEARAVNLIQHPNIIDIKDFVEGDAHPPYMVMEYVEGESLSHYIQHQAPIAPETVVAIATQICSALQAVHDQGIVHRDLKPDNVILRKEPDGTLQAKLLDFGVAKFIGNQDTFLKTLSGAAVGTPEYMAPEQIVGEKVDHRIDIYALGVILYEMLTSRQPFAATTVGELVTAHLTVAPVPPAERLVELGAEPIPPELNDTVLKCLAKEADERVGSMEALRKMLRVGIGETTTPLPMAALEALGTRRVKRSGLVWILGGVAALLLAGLGLAFGPGLLSGSDKSTGDGGALMGARSNGNHQTMRPSPVIASRRVWVTSVPGGASLFRQSDGRFLGKTPTSVVCKKSERVALRLRLNGYRDSMTEVGYALKGPLRVILTAVPPPQGGDMAMADGGVTPPGAMQEVMRLGMRPTMRAGMRPITVPVMRPMDNTTMGTMRDLGGTLDPFGMTQ